MMLAGLVDAGDEFGLSFRLVRMDSAPRRQPGKASSPTQCCDFKGLRPNEREKATPEPPMLLGRSKGPGSGSDRTRPHRAANPIATIGPPSLRVAQAREPGEIF